MLPLYMLFSHSPALVYLLGRFVPVALLCHHKWGGTGKQSGSCAVELMSEAVELSCHLSKTKGKPSKGFLSEP